jgi:hypothetical protein
MSKNMMHDYKPRLKSMIKEAILDVLYAPVNKTFQKDIDALIDKNGTLQAGSPSSFRYRDVTYTHSTATPPRHPYPYNRLADVLKHDMDKILGDRKDLEDHEKPYVENYINKILNSSDNLLDYIALLPDYLRPPVQKLIDTCPCRNCSLSTDKIKEIHDSNAKSFGLIKLRMAKNLIL